MTKIIDIETLDIRFPTSDLLDGSDAMNPDPDYSAAYVILKTNDPDLSGHGLTFTIGRGNDLCVAAINSLKHLVLGISLEDFQENPAKIWKKLTSDSQLRWLGPDKGIIHLATCAIVNALWDLWAKKEKKSVWKLVADLTPEELVNCIDFTYLTDCITKDEALELLKDKAKDKEKREKILFEEGYPCYTTSPGWLGYSEEKLARLCQEAIDEGFNHIKLKCGADLEEDKRRVKIARDIIGPDRYLMIDANQVWERQQAIDWVKELAFANIWFIEEPTSPDDVEAHRAIKEGVAPIKVATGEMCQNRIMFKQFMMREALDIVQVDAGRMGGLNEVLAVLLMAAKYNLSVCPHAGGVGLCEYVQHISMIDYLCFSGRKDNHVTEFVDHLHEHFFDPCVVKNAAYMPPTMPGFSIEMKPESRQKYLFKK